MRRGVPDCDGHANKKIAEAKAGSMQRHYRSNEISTRYGMFDNQLGERCFRSRLLSSRFLSGIFGTTSSPQASRLEASTLPRVGAHQISITSRPTPALRA